MTSAPSRKALHIAVGVLTKANGDVLIAQRQSGKPGAGEWEFPGGKRHPGESIQTALARELREELGIVIQTCERLIRIRHAYPDRTVLLDTWRVDAWHGEARGAEGQPIAWVSPGALPTAGLLAADAPIANAIHMPARYAISPAEATTDELLAWLAQPRVPMLRVRLPSCTDTDYWQAWPVLSAAARAAGVTLVADRLPGTIIGPVSVHLAAADTAKLQQRPAGLDWFGVSCHTPQALRRAADIGADFAVLGHVQATPSHAGQAPLGWPRWGRWADAAQLPVYAIGGVGGDDVTIARNNGGQGVAGIRAYW